MADYVDQTYYDGTYHGQTVASSDFSKLLARATDVVNSLTKYQIVQKGGLDKYDDLTQELVKKAVCAQIEYYEVEGVTADQGQTESSSSFSLSKFSVSQTQDDLSRNAKRYSPSTLSYLQDAGLYHKGGVKFGFI